MRKMFICFAAVLMVFLPGCSSAAPEIPVYSLEITIFGVGKADAILVQADGFTMMIDCAEEKDSDRLLDELDNRGITHLDLLEITHFDKDHVGGAATVVNALDVGKIIFPDYVGTRKEFRAFTAAAEQNGGASAVKENESFLLGGAAVTVFPASDPDALIDEDKEYDNELSLVTRIEYADRVFLFCGDIEKGRIKQMIAGGTDWSCDWIKLPHHGKYDKQLSKLLESCMPGYSVMTVSDEEPADERTFDLLGKLGIEGFDTQYGDVVTLCDSEGTITVSHVE